jgi:phenylalanyl-tRNA synthetase beta chain
VQNGFNEIITQNMMDPKSAAIFGEELVTIANPLGEELSILRPSTIASMLKTLNHNIRVGNSRMRLFELGKSFHRVNENVPTFIKTFMEKQELTIAIAGKAFPKQWSMAERDVDYYDIKGVAEGLLAQLRIEGLKYKEVQEEIPAFSKNTVAIMQKKQIVGYVGEVNNKIKKHYDIEMPVFIAWFDMSVLNGIEPVKPYYSKVAPFPGSTRDLAFIVAKEVKADDILNQIMQNGGKLLQSVNIFDVYEGKNVANGKKSLAYSLHFAAPDRTLKDSEVDQAINKVIQTIEKKFEAELRG